MTQGEMMNTKDINLRIPIEMYDSLNRIAKSENRPRSFVMREFLQRGIESKKEAKKNGSK